MAGERLLNDIERIIIEGNLRSIAQLLSIFRISHSCEKALQEAIGEILNRHYFENIREFRLSPGNIIDFAILLPVGRMIVAEVKTKGSLAAVTRQLFRYAADDEVGGVLLITTKSTLSNIPATILGKPARAVVLPGGLA